jgi:hypothetical protein
MMGWAATLDSGTNRRIEMGWNAGYTIFEATVVGAYDLGKLDKELLTVLMEPYRDTDIDSGGKEGLLSKDGKEAEQIVIEIWGLEMPKAPPGKYDDDSDAWDAHNDAVYDLFRVVKKHFGWC